LLVCLPSPVSVSCLHVSCLLSPEPGRDWWTQLPDPVRACSRFSRSGTTPWRYRREPEASKRPRPRARRPRTRRSPRPTASRADGGGPAPDVPDRPRFRHSASILGPVLLGPSARTPRRPGADRPGGSPVRVGGRVRRNTAKPPRQCGARTARSGGVVVDSAVVGGGRTINRFHCKRITRRSPAESRAPPRSPARRVGGVRPRIRGSTATADRLQERGASGGTRSGAQAGPAGRCGDGRPGGRQSYRHGRRGRPTPWRGRTA